MFGVVPLEESTLLVNLDFVKLDSLGNISWSGGVFVVSGAHEDLPNRPYIISDESCSSSMSSATTAKPHKGRD